VPGTCTGEKKKGETGKFLNVLLNKEKKMKKGVTLTPTRCKKGRESRRKLFLLKLPGKATRLKDQFSVCLPVRKKKLAHFLVRNARGQKNVQKRRKTARPATPIHLGRKKKKKMVSPAPLRIHSEKPGPGEETGGKRLASSCRKKKKGEVIDAVLARGPTGHALKRFDGKKGLSVPAQRKKRDAGMRPGPGRATLPRNERGRNSPAGQAGGGGNEA